MSALEVRPVRPGTAELEGAAELCGEPASELAAWLASLPPGIEPVALCVGDQVIAYGLDLVRELARTGVAKLVRVYAYDRDSGLALVAHAVAQARAARARALEAGIARAPGVGDALAARGWRRIESHVTMGRPARGLAGSAPLPAGVVERTLAEVGDAAFVEVGNVAFAATPGAFPLTRDDFARIRLEPGFADGAFCRALADSEGPIGFLRGHLLPEGIGEVVALGLVPRARGRGLGRWLLHRCEQLLEGGGARELKLSVAASNVAAFALYEREGYREESRRDVYEIALG